MAGKIKVTENGISGAKDGSRLLVVIVNRGFAEDVVEKSRLEGATGATILSGRGTAGVGQMFMGMQITPEKEIVLIAIEEKYADAAMKKITETLGMVSAASGICFNVPIAYITKKAKAPTTVPEGEPKP
jgi:nitrogen regulatory protein PII